MRIAIILLILGILQARATDAYSQKTRLSINFSDVALVSVLDKIEEESEFFFLYNEKLLDTERKVTINAKNQLIDALLENLFVGTDVKFTIIDRKIILAPKYLFNEADSGTIMQQIKVNGIVTDASKGDALPGVNVVIKGSTVGANTDINGNFTLVVPSTSVTLIFSFIGYITQEVPLAGQSTLNVSLKPELTQLNEVVVVGYGTQRKVNLTGAVSTVSAEQMKKRPVTSPVNMLQAQVAGVQIVQGLGQPGQEAFSVRIRGQGTYSSAGSEPLVLIDGVAGSLANLNANDIETVSVLKDAASASIYGARAANGVILVTTKRGEEGALRIEYNGNIGVHTPTKMLEVVTNSYDYMQLYNEAKMNSGIATTSNTYTQAIMDLYQNSSDQVNYPNYDWLGALFTPATVQNHTLSLGGGTKGTLYNVSIGYVNQPGTFYGFSYEKFTFRLNLESKIKPWATIGVNMYLENGYQSAPRQGQADAFIGAIAQAPTYGPYLPDGSGRFTHKAYPFESTNKNMFAIVDSKVLMNTITYDLAPQIWADIKIAKGLNWYTKAAVDLIDVGYKDWRPVVNQYYFQDKTFSRTLDVGTVGLVTNHNQNFYTNLYSYLKYDWDLGTNNHFSAQAGYSQEDQKYNYIQAYRQNFVSPNLQEIDAGSTAVQTANGSATEWAIRSFFSRLNYNFKGKYLLEVNTRRDATSRLAPDNRFGWFPSASVGWRLTEESFMKNLNLNWLNNLKIRGSYGLLGNQNIGIYPYQDLLSFTGNYPFDNANLLPGVAQTAYSNSDIRWESTSVEDIGLDLTLFKGLNITYDWYNKHTSDILRGAQVTAVMGLTAPTINSGEMVNIGNEITVQYTNEVKNGSLNGLTYSAGFYFDMIKNKLVNFGAREIGEQTLNQNNSPYYSYYLLQNIGVFQSQEEIVNSPKQFSDNVLPGDFKYADANGDNIVDANDRVIVPGRFPKFEYSINGNASWKGFDISILFQGVEGRKIYCNGWGYEPFRQGSSPTTDWLTDRWTGPGTSNHKPRMYYDYTANSQNRRANTYYLLDASYFRLKNLSIGYSLPKKWTYKLKIERLRVYFSGDNLLTATPFPYLDPERAGDGNFAQYPQNKVVSFGVTLDI